MLHSDEAMQFETHFAQYKHFIKSVNSESDLYFTHKAQDAHALAVWDGSQKLIFATLNLVKDIASPDARHHIQFGLGRRTQAIWRAFRQVYSLIPPDRLQPLPMGDVIQASNDLNAIYINIHGALDNFAWALHHILCNGEMGSLRVGDIGLFNTQFLKQPTMHSVRDTIKPYQEWYKGFRDRRDPAAHRVPLSIVPSIQSGDSLTELAVIDSLINEKTQAAAQAGLERKFESSQALFAEIEELNAQREKIGTFYPFFEFDPRNRPIPVYPTLAEDVGNYVVISNKMIALLGQGNRVI